MTNFDIIRYLNDKNISYKTAGKNIGKDWIGLPECLWCRKENSHLGINVKTNYVNCWLCGGKNLNDFLYKIEKNWHKVNQILENYKLDVTQIQQYDVEEKIVKTSYSLPKEFTTNFTDPYKLYLKNRNFDFLELRKKYNILCGNDFGRAKYRIVFPVYENNRIVNWVARTILKDKSTIPYMFEKDENLPLVNRRELLYGLDDSVCDTVILVEGVFDKINIGKNCIAMLSIAFSREQILKLRRFKNFFLCFDSEESAQKRARELESYLTWADNINYVNFDKKDPGLFDKKEVLELRRLCF